MFLVEYKNGKVNVKELTMNAKGKVKAKKISVKAVATKAENEKSGSKN